MPPIEQDKNLEIGKIAHEYMNCLCILAEIILKVGISLKLSKALNLTPIISFDPKPRGEPMDVDTNFLSENPNLDLPIALRKGTRLCTQHPISRFVSYEQLSPAFRVFITIVTKTDIPKTIQEALADSNWRHTIQEEMNALERNGTWEMIELPRAKKIVGCKRVFTVKFNADGSISRYKARLVVEGFDTNIWHRLSRDICSHCQT